MKTREERRRDAREMMLVIAFSCLVGLVLAFVAARHSSEPIPIASPAETPVEWDGNVPATAVCYLPRKEALLLAEPFKLDLSRIL